MEAITVTKLNTYIKQIFDSEELLHNIAVVGEVFDVSLSRNVIYFSLKDENASLSCVCFYPNLIDDIIEGQKVIVTGSPNYYVKGGRFNFNVVRVERVGQGKLYEEFLLLKEKLEKEGLFDEVHKKPIPSDIKRIGVITSREGAVIQDIKNVSWRRNPSVDIVLYNTKVQGNGAENEIAHAIEVMGEYEGVDVIIVARGGGSLEDLWAYNTEIVARATYNCPKPIVSAVGHETDFTIIDFVSDLRAPTPSAAAELLNFNIEDKRKELSILHENFVRTFEDFYGNQKYNLISSANLFYNLFDKTLIGSENQLNQTQNKCFHNFETFINQKYYEMGIIENTLKKENPLEILNKGYAKVEQGKKTINSSGMVDMKQDLNLIFSDGSISAKPIERRKNEN